jgi:ribosomal protein S25
MGRKRKQGVLIDAVVEKIIKEDYISTPFIQRQFQISYLKAREILKLLEKMGYIEKVDEFKPVKVLKHNYIQ